MTARTRSGVFGVARKKSGRWRSRAPLAITLARQLDMAEHDLTRTPPADRHEIADAAADDQSGRTEVVSQETVRIEDGPRKQSISVRPGDHLAAVQVAGQHQVISGKSRRPPNRRVVRAQHANVPVD